jgi:alkanesulfonate monooxygenase SsuD/methylene tetrahydromethanopterin reductase-like flavin-dependent oxidoreductase (luciferase family)
MRLSLLLTDGDDARLLLEVAREADRRGLAALWLPELQGASLFPNPAVAAAAVAVATRRLGVRAAGLALPLHNPIRVAEEWSLVDNLSRGRVGIAASTADEGIETVRRLWRGNAARVPDGEGRPIEIRILPRPLQPELPLWLPAARSAAALGANLLLAEPDAERIAAYRAAGGGGLVTVTVPAFTSAELEPCAEIGADEVACRVPLAGALAALEVHHGG